MARRKRLLKGRDCARIRNLLESAGIRAQDIISYLERVTKEDEAWARIKRQEAPNLPDPFRLQYITKATELEMGAIKAQMLVSILRIALMEEKSMNYISPSLN